MKTPLKPIALSVALCLGTSGCWWTYWPLRMPNRELLTPAPSEREGVRLQSAPIGDYGTRAAALGVSVAVDLLDAAQTKQTFGADLLRHGIQPLLIAIDNQGSETYAFSKAEVSAPYVPASDAARWAYEGPVKRSLDVIRWLIFLVPGFVFSAVVEPASTLDFPGIKEAATRPSRSANKDITADFRKHEIPETTVGPNASLSGVMFTRPLHPDSAITITLTNAATREPLVFEIPVPHPPVDRQRHIYAKAFPDAWEASVKSAAKVPCWTVASKDEERGLITVKKAVQPFWWTARILVVSVQGIDEKRTLVEIQQVMPGSGAVVPAGRQRGIDKFFEEMGLLLPTRLPPPAAPAPEGSSAAPPSSTPPQAVPLAARP